MASSKARKIFLGLAFAFVAVAAAGYFSLDFIVQRFRPTIEAILTEKLGRPTSFDTLSIAFFPSTSFKLEGFQVKNTGPDGKPAGIKLGSLFAETSLVSIVSGKPIVSSLRLENTDVSVVRLADGSVTVGGIPLGGAAQDTSSETAAPKDDSAKNELGFEIDALEISNLRISVEDKAISPPQKIELKDLNLVVTGLGKSPKAEFDFSASFLGTTAKNIRLAGSLSPTGAMMLQPDLSGNLAFENLDLEKISALLSAYAPVPLPAMLKGTATFQAKYVAKSIGDISVQPSLNLTDADLQVPGIFEKARGIRFTLDADFLKNQEQANLQKLDLLLGTSSLHGKGKLSGSIPDSFVLENSQIDLADAAKILPSLAAFQTQGKLLLDVQLPVLASGSPIPEILGSIRLEKISAAVPQGEQKIPIEDLSGTLKFEKETIGIEGFAGKFANQAFSIKGKIQSPQDPVGALVLALPRLQLGEVMAQLGKANPTLEGSYLSNLQVASSFQVTKQVGGIKISAGESKVGPAPLNSLNLQIDIQPDLVTLKPSVIGIFGGNLALDGQVKSFTEPFFDIRAGAKNLNLKDMMAVAKPGAPISITGTLSDLKLTASGRSTNIPLTLSANLGATAVRGEITGVNVIGEVFRKIDQIPGLGQAALASLSDSQRSILTAKGTAFDSLTVQAQMRGQSTNLPSFSLNHSLYLITGNGNIGPSEGTLAVQVRLTPALTSTLMAREPRVKLLLDPAGNVTIPVIIKLGGPIPVVLPDVEELLKNAARKKGAEAAGRVLDRVAPGLGQVGEGVISNIFK